MTDRARFTEIPMGIKPWQIFILCVVYVGLLGAVDYFIPYESSFSVFYLIPIVLASWYSGRWYAILTCLISAGVQMAGDIMSGHVFTSQWIIPWNMTVRLSFFMITALLIVSIREHLVREQILSHTDSLTEINNLRSFKKWLDYHISIADRQHNSLALAYIDMDDFKKINDTKGHATGDEVLKAVAAILSKKLRSTDIVGRIGGDEFTVLIPGIEQQYVSLVFDRIFRCLNEEMEKNSWAVGFSIGVAVFLQPPESVEEALETADSLMYEVKKKTKNDVIYRVIQDSSIKQSNLPFMEDKNKKKLP